MNGLSCMDEPLPEVVTFERASEVAAQVYGMPQFKYPVTNGIGVTNFPLHEDGEYAVSVHFVGDKPDWELPDRIGGVKVVYHFNLGEIVALSAAGGDG